MCLDRYCFCYGHDVGIPLIGFLQMNAAMFFFARFSTLEPIYMWLDLAVAIQYTVRVIFFWQDFAADQSIATRRDYFEWNKWMTLVQAVISATIVALQWIEWSHVPTWILASWAMAGLLEGYHWFVIRDYAQLTGSWNTYGEPVPSAVAAEETKEEGEDEDEDLLSTEKDAAFALLRQIQNGTYKRN